MGVRLKLDSRTGILMVVFRQRDGETGTHLPSASLDGRMPRQRDDARPAMSAMQRSWHVAMREGHLFPGRKILGARWLELEN